MEVTQEKSCIAELRAAAFTCQICGDERGKALYEGIQDWEFGVTGEWSHVQCEGCGIVSLHPFPSVALISDAYPPSYASWNREERPSLVFQWLNKVFNKYNDKPLFRRLPCVGGWRRSSHGQSLRRGHRA